MESSRRDKATRGTLQKASQDESDFDPNKARIGLKPKEKQEDVLQVPNISTLGADFRGHPSGKSLHLGKGVRNSAEPD